LPCLAFDGGNDPPATGYGLRSSSLSGSLLPFLLFGVLSQQPRCGQAQKEIKNGA